MTIKSYPYYLKKYCPNCKTILSELGMLYKKRFIQYMCSTCNIVYLKTNRGLVNGFILEQVGNLMNEEKFTNLLNRLEE